MKNNKNTYKEVIAFICKSEDEKESLHKVFCDDGASFGELAEYYNTTPTIMRRIIMEMLGEDGYLRAKNQRKFLTKKRSKWTASLVKYGRGGLIYKVIKLLIDSEKSYFQISKDVNCSRERVAQIAAECVENGLKLNEARQERIKKDKYYQNRKVRGYSN